MSIAPTGMSTAVERADERGHRPAAAAIGAATLGLFGAAFSWKLDRVPRLAAVAALTGALAGGLGGAVIASGPRNAEHGSRLRAAADHGIVGAGAGMLLIGGLAGIVLPSVSVVDRMPAIREFALYGVLAGGLVGAGVGALRSGGTGA